MADNEIAFRLLAAELEATNVAGFHDFRTAFVEAPFAGDRLISSHEGIHDELLTGTYFGNYQRIFQRLSKVAEGQMRDAATTVFAELIRMSTLTHECTATYLSIKSYAPELIPELVRRLPKQYQFFYSRYSEVIEPAAASTFSQFLIAKAIGCMAMNGDLLEQFGAWTPDSQLNIPTDQRPDSRLAAILSNVSQNIGTLYGAISNRMRAESTGLTADFNWMDEQAWEGLKEDGLASVEEFFWKAINAWLLEIAGYSCLTLPRDQLETSMQLVLGKIELASGLRLYDRNVDVAPKSQLRADELGYQGRWANSFIQTIASRNIEVPRLPDDLTSDMITNPRGPRIYITHSIGSNNTSDLQWYRLVQADKVDGEAYYVDQLSHLALKKMFRIRNHYAALGGRWEPQAVMVGPLSPFDNALSIETYNEIVACHQLGDRQGPLIGTDKLIWYMGDNIFRWYDALLNAGSTRFAMFHVKTDSDDDKQRVKQALTGRGSLSWWAFKCDAYYGLFYRITSYGASLPLSGVINEDLQHGSIEKFSEDEQREVLELLMFVARAPWTVWPVV